MDEQLIRSFQRWQDAEDRGLDDQADAAFARVFRSAIRTEAAPAPFTARTMAAVGVAIEREERRVRRMRRIVAPVAAGAAIAMVYFSGGLLVSALSAALVAVLDLIIAAVVGIATTIPAGADVWTVLSTVGRATAALLATPAVTMTILAIQGVAIAAFVALQRILRSDRELLR
jgi:hypothetical protein